MDWYDAIILPLYVTNSADGRTVSSAQCRGIISYNDCHTSVYKSEMNNLLTAEYVYDDMTCGCKVGMIVRYVSETFAKKRISNISCRHDEREEGKRNDVILTSLCVIVCICKCNIEYRHYHLCLMSPSSLTLINIPFS